MDKPPIGARPAYITSGARIKELAKAISRYADNASDYPDSIERWAKEIIIHIDLLRSCCAACEFKF